MSLWDYSTKDVVLREPAEKNGRVVCPECGRDLENEVECGSIAHVPLSQLVDVDLASALDVDDLPTNAWVCRRHPQYAVVCPNHAESMSHGWVGILVEFADGHARRVPVPRKEVRTGE